MVHCLDWDPTVRGRERGSRLDLQLKTSFAKNEHGGFGFLPHKIVHRPPKYTN